MAQRTAIQVRFVADTASEDASAVSFEVEDVTRPQDAFKLESYTQSRGLKFVRMILPVLLVLGVALIIVYRLNHAPYSFKIPFIRSESWLPSSNELVSSLLGTDWTDETEDLSSIPQKAPPEQELYGMLEDVPAKAELAAPGPTDLLNIETGPSLEGASELMVFDDAAPGPALAPAAEPLPSELVKRGTFLPAILETPIEPDTPSGVRALLPMDVKGHDNSATLPKSSRLVGQYFSKVSAGRQRVFIIWKQLTLPDGRVLQLPSGSIAKDQFFNSFGSASMISVLEPEGKSDSFGRVRTGEALRVITSKDVVLETKTEKD
ncbi:MAG: hypothetical protein KDE32_10740 [Novosphingobium sp.]|nr:hypothetical protein [Novosphingobium sp.]